MDASARVLACLLCAPLAFPPSPALGATVGAGVRASGAPAVLPIFLDPGASPAPLSLDGLAPIPGAEPVGEAGFERKNAAIQYGRITPEEIDAAVSERILAGEAYKVWGKEEQRVLPDELDMVIPYRTGSYQVLRAKRAVAEAIKKYDTRDWVLGTADLDKELLGLLDDVDIVAVADDGLLYRRDEDNFQAAHIGWRRKTIYVGETLWSALLDNPRALAGFLAHELHHLARPGQDHGESEIGARLTERRADPANELRGIIADLAVPAPPVHPLGEGDFAGMMSLFLRAAVSERPKLDLRALFGARFDGLSPRLERLLSRREKEIREELSPLLDIVAEYNRKIKAKYDDMSDFSSRVSHQVSEVLVHDLVQASSPWRLAAASVQARLAEIGAARSRLNWIGSELGRRSDRPLSLDEYEELVRELFGVLSVEHEPRLRRLLVEETQAMLDSLPEALIREPGKAPTGGAKAFLNALREEAGVYLEARAYAGRDLYRRPGLLALGFLSRNSEGGLSFSVQEDVLEYWLSPAGRADLSARTRSSLGRISDEDYPRFLARVILNKEEAWPRSLEDTAALRQGLIESGAEELERRFYGRFPDLEAAYARQFNHNTWRWFAAVGLFLAAIAADLARGFVFGNWMLFGRHLLGYLGLFWVENTAYFADHRHLFYVPRPVSDASLPLGLKSAVERIAGRAGYSVGEIRLSGQPDPRAWAIKPFSTEELGSINLILTESLVEKIFDGGRTRAFDAVLGQAIAHTRHGSRRYLRLASVGFWHLIDHLDPFPGLASWLIWGASALPSYYLSAWLFRGQERFADTAGARLAGAPGELAAFFRDAQESALQSEHGPVELPPRLHEPDYGSRAESLRALSRPEAGRP